MLERRIALFILILALGLHAALCIYAARIETPTVDEYAHMPAGLSYWRYGSFDLYSKNPPLIKLWTSLPVSLGWAGSVQVPKPEGSPLGWGPWLYGMQYEKVNATNYFDSFFAARLMVIFLSMGSALLIFCWLRAEAGEVAAAVASAGFLLSQTVLAHSHLATVDVGSTFTILLFCFVLRWPARDWKHALLTGTALGLALASKFTGVFLLPLLFIPAIGRIRFTHSILALLTALVVVFACYGFQSPVQSWGSYRFQSRAISKISGVMPGGIPVPLPKDFVVGFDAQMVDTENGEFGSYLFGEWSAKGWWYYNLAALALKENLLTLLLLLLAPFLLFRRGSPPGFQRALWPALLLGVPLTFLNVLQLGVRYLLPIFPFLFICVGYVFKGVQAKWGKRVSVPLIAACLFVWSLSAVLQAPEHLSYFNVLAFVLGEKEELLLDSNLDWGQDLFRVPKLAEKFGQPLYLLYFGHVSPPLYGIHYELVPDHPVKGIVIVSANFLKGMPYVTPAPDGALVQTEAGRLRWLSAYKPVQREGSLLVFDTRTGN